jgi:hypothetical protein
MDRERLSNEARNLGESHFVPSCSMVRWVGVGWRGYVPRHFERVKVINFVASSHSQTFPLLARS